VSNYQIMSASEDNIRGSRTATAHLGRVVHDPRGNAVWDWAIETGVLAKTTVNELLSKLVEPMPMALELDSDRAAHWCGDPYNRSL
jgi:hypothetical protein